MNACSPTGTRLVRALVTVNLKPQPGKVGLDRARAYLGQLSLGATALYARQLDLESAAEVARRIG